MLQDAGSLLGLSITRTVARIGVPLPACNVEQPAVRSRGKLADTRAAVPQRATPDVRRVQKCQKLHGQAAWFNLCATESMLGVVAAPSLLQPAWI